MIQLLLLYFVFDTIIAQEEYQPSPTIINNYSGSCDGLQGACGFQTGNPPPSSIVGPPGKRGPTGAPGSTGQRGHKVCPPIKYLITSLMAKLKKAEKQVEVLLFIEPSLWL